MAFPSLSLRASVRLPYHVSSPRSPNRTCGFPASRLSSGIMRLAHRSPVAFVDDSYGIGTLPYSIHFRSRGAARPVDALTTPSSSNGPFTFACDASGVSGPFAGVSGFRHSRDPSPFGHRSSPEAPSLHGRYPASPVLQASPPPCRPGLPLAGSRFGVCLTTHRASRVAAFFSFHACQRHYPDGSGSVPASLSSPSAIGLPLKTGGSASVLSVSRPARRSLAFRPACSLSRPWRPLSPECFRPFRCLHDPPWLLPTGATVVGRDSHPPEEDAFPRRTVSSWITLFLLFQAGRVVLGLGF